MKKKIISIVFLLTMLFINVSNVSAKTFNNYNPNGDFTCGSGTTLPVSLATTTHYIILMVQIVIPIAIVIFGMFDLSKAVTSGKEDEIKKNQGIFVKRLIAGICVFFVVTITKLLINLLSTNNTANCIDCFVNGPNSCFKVE